MDADLSCHNHHSTGRGRWNALSGEGLSFRVPGAVRPKAFVVFLILGAAALMLVPLASQSLTLMFLCIIVIGIGITLGGAYATLLGEVAASIGGPMSHPSQA